MSLSFLPCLSRGGEGNSESISSSCLYLTLSDYVFSCQKQINTLACVCAAVRDNSPATQVLSPARGGHDVSGLSCFAFLL